MGLEALLSSQIIGLSEAIDDEVASLLVAGSGISLSYNDGAGTLTIANTGLGGSTGSTDNRILRSDGTGGATVQNSAVTIDDSGNITGLAAISAGNGSISASAPVLVLAQTWNNAGVAFNAIDLNVSNTASATLSTFATFRRDGTNRIVFYDRYDSVALAPAIQLDTAIIQGAAGGHVALGTTGNPGMIGLTNGVGLSIASDRVIGWGSSNNAVRDQGSSWTDTRLARNAAGQLDVRGNSGFRVRNLGYKLNN